MPTHSAGILLYRIKQGVTEVFLVHPGGPFWAKKDAGAWSIPKGEFDPETEDALQAAKGEFEEEIGQNVNGDFKALPPVKQKSGKIVHAFAIEGDVDAANIKSNMFETEWPPKSGKKQSFQEVDRAAWVDLQTARKKILQGQLELLEKVPDSER